MKNSITFLIIFCSLSVFAQNTASNVEYDQVILDGKPAYMNVVTGEIVSTKPNTTSNNRFDTSTSTDTKEVANANTITTNTHMIAKGETLYSISKKYGVTVAQLKELNANIDMNALSVNQKLIVKKSIPDAVINTTFDTNPSKTYTVNKGDTLYALSKKFNTTVGDLMTKNNLTSSLLSIGQNLIIR